MGWDGGCPPRAHRDLGVGGRLFLVPAAWRRVRNGTRGARPAGGLLQCRLAGKRARGSGSTTRHVTITYVTSTVHLKNTQLLHTSAVSCWQDGLVLFDCRHIRRPWRAHPGRGTRPPPLSSRRFTHLGFRDTSWRRTPSGAHLPAIGRGNDRVADATFPTGGMTSVG